MDHHNFPAKSGRKLRPRMIASLMLSLAVIPSALAWNLSAEVKLHDRDGNRVGRASLTQRGGGDVFVEVRVRDLGPGFHGFHVHAVGECTPPFTTAGPHFNLKGNTHGDHSGDFPVLLVNRDGEANASFSTGRFSLADLFDADGSALIIHANPDNYAHIPTRYVATPDETTLATGDAGDRIVCGVIEKVIKRDKGR